MLDIYRKQIWIIVMAQGWGELTTGNKVFEFRVMRHRKPLTATLSNKNVIQETIRTKGCRNVSTFIPKYHGIACSRPDIF